MIKQRSTRISCSQRFFCAPSFALTSSNLLLTVSVRTIVMEVASLRGRVTSLQKRLPLRKISAASKSLGCKSNICGVSPVSILQVCSFKQLDYAEKKKVQWGNCQFSSQHSVQKLHLPKMGGQWVQVNVYTLHVCLHSSTTHRASFIIKLYIQLYNKSFWKKSFTPSLVPLVKRVWPGSTVISDTVISSDFHRAVKYMLNGFPFI